jgi:putative dehydrogenase
MSAAMGHPGHTRSAGKAAAAGPIGLIGLGVMGSAIGGLLIASGADLHGFDIDEGRQQRFAAAGGAPAASPADVAGQCQVVLTSLPTAAALHDVVGGHNGLITAPAGQRVTSLVLELSTLALADKRAAREELAAAGVAMADVPLSGTGAQARTGDLVAFVSADARSDRDRAAAVVRPFTRAQYDVGVFGNGSMYKYVANLLVAVHNVAAAEALVLAERAGLDLPTVLTAVGDGAGASRMLQVRGPLMAGRDYADPSVRLEVFRKDVAIISEFAADVGAPVPLLAVSSEIYQAAQAAGWTGQDTAAVAEVLRARATAGSGSRP